MTNLKQNKSNAFLLLILAAIVFFVLSRIPFGNTIQWPFVIITTFIHEMGHGLTAIAVGGELSKVELYSHGGGTAFVRTFPGWPHAAVAAGGLLAPSIIGALFIRVGLQPRSSAITFMINNFLK